MKLGTAEADGFCARPDPGIALVVLYGPDQGLVAERRRRLVGAVLGQADDPFRLVELDVERVGSAPGLLLEEAQALSLVGGRRIVLLRQAGDALAPPLEALLALGGHEALVVVEAGELGAGSKLRRLAEKQRNAAAIACYRADGAQLEAQIRGYLREHRLSAEADAMAFLASHLGGNRELTRAEIDKLALYVGDREGGRVTLADVAAVVGNSSALGMDALVWAVLVGRPGTAAGLLERLLGEGVAPVRLIRAIAAMLFRLLPLAERVAGGEAAAAVLRSLKPPLHFSQQAPMQRALEAWPPGALEAALQRAVDAERLCKRGRSPSVLVVRRLLHDLGVARGSPART